MKNGMCGIAGFTHRNRRADRSVARRITAGLAHRGPDQQGIHEAPGATLCAVRLKIIDLEGGDQPIVSEDGAIAIAFNGEIYNHAELRRELEARDAEEKDVHRTAEDGRYLCLAQIVFTDERPRGPGRSVSGDGVLERRERGSVDSDRDDDEVVYAQRPVFRPEAW